MKLLFTTDTITRGGKERQIFVLASSLRKQGHDVAVYSLRYNESNYIDEYNFPRENIYLGIQHNEKSATSLSNCITAFSPEIVFSFDVITSWQALKLRSKKKFIFINGSIRHGRRRLKKAHLIRSLILWLSPYRVANSDAGLFANNVYERKRSFVLYNGVDERFFVEPGSLDKKALRKKLLPNLPENAKLFISVANLMPYKDHKTVLKALAMLKQNYNFYHLIVGDGPMRAEIEQYIDDLGLRNNVQMLGRIPQVKEYVQIADCMIHSSEAEGISNAILEAMYAGIPVIASNVGGTPELVFPQSCKLFAYKDVQTLYSYLVDIETTFKDFNASSAEYRAHLEKFSVATMIKSFESIIQQILIKEKNG